jgi:hypothetical protein
MIAMEWLLELFIENNVQHCVPLSSAITQDKAVSLNDERKSMPQASNAGPLTSNKGWCERLKANLHDLCRANLLMTDSDAKTHKQARELRLAALTTAGRNRHDIHTILVLASRWPELTPYAALLSGRHQGMVRRALLRPARRRRVLGRPSRLLARLAAPALSSRPRPEDDPLLAGPSSKPHLYTTSRRPHSVQSNISDFIPFLHAVFPCINHII